MMEKLDSQSPNHILIGLGGTGGKVLKALRKRLFLEFPNETDRAQLSIGFIYVDSTREMMQPGDPSFKVMGKDASFTESEFVDIKSVNLGQILDNVDNFPGLKNIVRNGASMRNTLGEVGAAAGQKRRAGRILFAANCNKYVAALRAQYEKVRAISRKDSVNIHIFTGLAGGTGSGAIIDAVAQARAQASFRDAVITVYAMVPELEIPAGCQAGRYHQNGYAALCELSALNLGRFLPCDVIRGDEHISLDLDSNKQFGLMLYSNINENGVTVNSFTELPQLLADTIYFRMFLEYNADTTGDFIRGLSSENINDFCVEYSVKSKGNDKERARTKAISSFGIKRVIYPEKRIIEHISYTIGQQVLRQMQYNNFKDDFGFVQESVKKDYKQLYINDAHLRDWRLSDSFLTLNEKIYDTDKNFDSIQDYWKSTTNFYSYDDAKAADKNPLKYLESFCEGEFKNNFRLKKGVEEYYQDKGDDRILKEQASYIVERIERDLYTKWYEGQLSLDDLLHICDEILIYIKKRRANIDAEITTCDEKIKQYSDDAAANEYDWSHASLIARAAGASARRYTDHQEILSDLYVEKTTKLAKKFQASLLGKLRAAFEEFHAQVTEFAGKLYISMEIAEKRIADRNQKSKGVADLSKAIIEVCEDEKMIKFERTIILDKHRQETLSGGLRKAIVGNRTFAHFDELAAQTTEDTIFDLFDLQLAGQIREIHDQECQQDKILGMNILQQLQKVLLTDDDIRRFASDVVNQSGVFLKLDEGQLSKALNNNPNPVSHPESINRKTILVSLPSYEGNDSLKAFAVKLENALKSSFGNGTPGSTIRFNISDQRMNEITIAAVKYCFPMRAISWMTNYEREYNDMVQNPNPTEAAEARVLLHSEGDGTQLPGIMGEKIIPLKEFTPYLFVAAANDLIQYAQDAREEQGWCMITEDEWGTPTTTFIAASFTDIPVSEDFTSEMRDSIQEKVDNILKNAELKVSERNAMVEKVKVLMRDFVSKECSSPTSPKYTQFGADARKAIEMINTKR